MKFCVIGVGRFGYKVATTLADNGMEVLAVDSNESIIASIRDKVTQAICMRVNDEESLRSIGVEEMDTVIVAMGENFAQSILVTALLKHRLKTANVITRSISHIHKEILELIGADQVILPEQEVGQQLADKLSLPFKVIVRLTPSFCISEFKVPENFVGQTIKDLDLQENYHVKVIAHRMEDEIIFVNEDYVVSPKDILVIAGHNRDIAKFSRL